MSTPANHPISDSASDERGSIWRTEFVKAKAKDGLVNFESQHLRFDERKRLSIHFDETLSLLSFLVSSGLFHILDLLLHRNVPCSVRQLQAQEVSSLHPTAFR